MSKIEWTTEGPDWMKELHDNPFNSHRKKSKNISDSTFEGAPFTGGKSFFGELFYIVGISVGLGVLLAMCS